MVDRARTIGAWVETHVISQIERHVGVIVLVGMLVLTGLGGEIWSLVMENRRPLGFADVELELQSPASG